MLSILFLVGGLALIIISANWLVDGASALAKKFGIHDLVIGLTVVAFGTSAPELTINIFAAISGSTDIALGNILGSNIANILLILGVSAIIYPIEVQLNTKWKEIPFSLLAIIVLGIMANDQLIDQSNSINMVSRIDGLILICFMVIFMVYILEITKHKREPDVDIKKMPLKKSIFLIVGGLAGLFFGGKYLVEGAVVIAKMLGMSEKVIGLTIIAIGTSLPELTTSIVAAYKKKADMAIGNVVGSNIFNVFFVLGLTAIIKPLPCAPTINFDILVALLASLLLFISTLTFGIRKITRPEGVVFIIIYIAYIFYSIIA